MKIVVFESSAQTATLLADKEGIHYRLIGEKPKEWKIPSDEVNDILQDKAFSAKSSSRYINCGTFSIGEHSDWLYSHYLFREAKELENKIFSFLKYVDLESQILDKGMYLLSEIHESPGQDFEKQKTFLQNYEFDDACSDDAYAWLTCILALTAVSKGNFGIGCLLFDSEENIVGIGHNQVFEPYFRSDRHAEMVVMSEFEDQHKELKCMKGYVLYTSLESCPMCLSRLITSGVNKIFHVSPDMEGGMVHRIGCLPSAWQGLASGRIFEQARCSDKIIDCSREIFSLNAGDLNQKLKARAGILNDVRTN